MNGQYDCQIMIHEDNVGSTVSECGRNAQKLPAGEYHECRAA